MIKWILLACILISCSEKQKMADETKNELFGINTWVHIQKTPDINAQTENQSCNCEDEWTHERSGYSVYGKKAFHLDKRYDSTQFVTEWAEHHLREHITSISIDYPGNIPPEIPKIFPNIRTITFSNNLPEKGIELFKNLNTVQFFNIRDSNILDRIPALTSLEHISFRYCFKIGKIDLGKIPQLKTLGMLTSRAKGIFCTKSLTSFRSLEVRNCNMDKNYGYDQLDLNFTPCLKSLILIHKGTAKALPKGIEQLCLENLTLYGITLNEEEKKIESLQKERLKQLSRSVASRK